jgi:hypothetical protein
MKKDDDELNGHISGEEVNQVYDDVPENGINDINRQAALGLINKIMRSLMELIDVIFGIKK